jgi:hypothetical protein
MFDNCNGHQINGGSFYNVAGNLEFRTHHHLNITNSTSELGCQAQASHLRLAIQDQGHFEVASGRRARESERQWTGVAKSLRGGDPVRPAPYGAFYFVYWVYTSHSC